MQKLDTIGAKEPSKTTFSKYRPTLLGPTQSIFWKSFVFEFKIGFLSYKNISIGLFSSLKKTSNNSFGQALSSTHTFGWPICCFLFKPRSPLKVSSLTTFLGNDREVSFRSWFFFRWRISDICPKLLKKFRTFENFFGKKFFCVIASSLQNKKFN